MNLKFPQIQIRLESSGLADLPRANVRLSVSHSPSVKNFRNISTFANFKITHFIYVTIVHLHHWLPPKCIRPKLDAQITNLDLSSYKVTLSIRSLEESNEKEAIEKYGAKDSGASLGAILGKALGRNKSEE